jgi:hypothetical protein
MSKRKPRVGSKKWDEKLWQNPTFHRNRLADYVKRAERGDKEAAERAAEILTRFPDFRASVRVLDDLITKVETAWVRVVSYGDPRAEKAVAENAAKLKDELLGPNPGLVDQVLANAVIVAYLAHQHAAALMTVKCDSGTLRAARERRLEVAQRRLFAAVKSFELIRRKRTGGASPRLGLKLLDTSKTG